VGRDARRDRAAERDERAAAARGRQQPRHGRATGQQGDAAGPPHDALAAALRRLGRVARGPGLVVVVSDFREGVPDEGLVHRDDDGIGADGRRGVAGRDDDGIGAHGRRDLAGPAARPEWARALRALGARHDLLAVEVVDPREGELPDAGQLVLVDPETGQRLEADTTSATLRRRFAAAELARRDELKSALRRAGARHVELSTDGDWLRALGRALR
ncbi:MAG TPA: hypothetical protein VK631_12240, partial [Solirubrobacteraceae bacterium]|nr:hypothetical protein [Solirubrobacteraceae bacterium]